MAEEPGNSLDPRAVPVLNTIAGTLLLALAFVIVAPNDGGIGMIAMALGGGILVLAGILGLWRPSRWGVSIEDRWIAVTYVIGIVLLVASLMVWVSTSQ